MTVYADILFAVNFIMDCLALYVTEKVLSLNKNRAGIFLSSLVGALYCVLKLFVAFPEPICAIAVSLMMCAIAFKTSGFMIYIKTIILFYSVNMLLGGIMTFIYQTAYRYRNASLFKNGLTPAMFFVCSGIIFLIVSIVGRIVSRFVKAKTVNAEIKICGKSKRVKLLCDTGNLLRDPYTGLPVIIVSASSFDDIFGKDGIHRHPENADSENAAKYKIRFIPVRTAAGSALLPGFSADKIQILSEKKRIDINAVIAVDNTSGAGGYAGDDGIIPYNLVNA